MRVFSLISLTAVLFAFMAAGTEPAPAPASPAPVVAASFGVAETQPAAKDPKKKTKSVDDEIKALGLRPCGVNAIMGKWKSGKVEKKLKTWAESGATDFDEPHKTGLNIAGMAKIVEWNKNKLRNNDPKAHDQLISDMEAAGKKLAEAANAKDSDGVKTASGSINQACNDCHARFK